jgi:hypothetical protein
MILGSSRSSSKHEGKRVSHSDDAHRSEKNLLLCVPSLKNVEQERVVKTLVFKS